MRQTLKDLKAEVKRLTELAQLEQERRAEAYRDKHQAQERTKELLEQLPNLKQRINHLELENARMSGYLERVREDDAERGDLVELQDPEGKKRTLLKRGFGVATPRILGGYEEFTPDGRRRKDWYNV